MPANVDGMVRAGIEAYRAGKKDEAKTLLLAAVEKDEQNEQAWLWLSQVVDEVDDRRTCLENVLAINPNNTHAQQGLKILDKRSGSAPKASSDDVLASASLGSAPVSKPATNPFSSDLDDEELPSSIEWNAPATETSSASTARKVVEPSPAEFDDWVSNLGIGGSKQTSSTFDESAASAFIGAKPVDDDDDGDFFNARLNANSPPPKPAKPASPVDHNPFEAADLFGNPESADVFGAGSLDDAFAELSPSKPAPPVKKPIAEPPAGRLSPMPPPSPAKAAPKLSPGKEVSPLDEEPDSDEDPFADLETDDGYDMDPGEYFEFIPPDIKPTRLPTMGKRYPASLVIGLALVIVLNVVAAVFLAMALSGSGG